MKQIIFYFLKLVDICDNIIKTAAEDDYEKCSFTESNC